MSGSARQSLAGPLRPTIAGLDPGRNKCGLILADSPKGTILCAAILPPAESLTLLERWHTRAGLSTVVLGNGTGSQDWPLHLEQLGLGCLMVEEAGSTLAARKRFWQLPGSRGWQRLLPSGMRLPPRDIDDVVAQLLVERHLGCELNRVNSSVLRQLPSPSRNEHAR